MSFQFFEFTMNPKPPYDFQKMVRRLKGVKHELYHFEENTLIRMIRTNYQVYNIRISGAGSLEQPKLHIQAETKAAHTDDPQAVEKHLQKMFSTELDLSPLYEQMKTDSVLAPLEKQFRGLKLILESDLFECMTKTIIGQQLNLAFAATLNRRLIERASSPYITSEGRVFPVFPSAEQVALLKVEDLRELQFSQRKAEYVIDFARAVTEGKINLIELESLSDEEVMEKLIHMRGIGRWTVECFLLFGLGRLNLLPAADIGLRNGIRKVYGLDYQPKEEEVRLIGESWSPWKSYVTFYMWEVLNTGKTVG